MNLSMHASNVSGSLRRTVICVGVMHLALLGVALGNVWWSEKVVIDPAKRMVVRTIAPSTQAVEHAVNHSQELVAVQPMHQAPPVLEPSKPHVELDVKQVANLPQVQTIKKEKEVKKEPKKEAAKKPVEVKKEIKSEIKPVENKKAAPKIDQKTLSALQKELQAASLLDKELPVIAAAPKLVTRPQLASTTVSSLSGVAEEDYVAQLKQYLQNSLRLPDVGEITIGVRLTAQGRVMGLEVLNKTSALNEKYVLEQVPQLTFPAWGKGTEEKYFPLTLRSK